MGGFRAELRGSLRRPRMRKFPVKIDRNTPVPAEAIRGSWHVSIASGTPITDKVLVRFICKYVRGNPSYLRFRNGTTLPLRFGGENYGVHFKKIGATAASS